MVPEGYPTGLLDEIDTASLQASIIARQIGNDMQNILSTQHKNALTTGRVAIKGFLLCKQYEWLHIQKND